MSRLVPLPVALPLLAAAVSVLLRRHRTAQRAISVATLTVTLGVSVALAVHVERTGEFAVAHLGGWPSRIGISYVADRLAAGMLVVAGATLLVVLLFAMGQRRSDERAAAYHPAYLVLAAGVAAAFLAGDLFHVFVAFEVLLTASYVLLTLEGDDREVRASTTYVVLNVVESFLLLAGVGLVYAATGTLSMSELPEALAGLDDGVRTGLHLLLLLAFGMKAAVFPLFFWLPDAYPTAPSPVTAVFAGLLTKVGVYALLRTQTLLFPGEHADLLLVVAGLTMIVGVLGAIAQNDVKRILSFHIVSQIGYMVFGMAVGGVAGVAATFFFLLHQIPIKTSLFLVEGVVEETSGTSALGEVSGLVHRSGLLAAAFLLPALSLAGLPPFSGFVGKLGLVRAGLDEGQHLLVGVALLGSLLTLVSMTKIWTGVFWGPPGNPAPLEAAGVRATSGAADTDDTSTSAGGPDGAGRLVPARRPGRLMTGATGALVVAGLGIAVLAGPLFDYCRRTAAELVDPSTYVSEVRGR